MRSRLVSLLVFLVLVVPAAGQFPPERPTLVLNSGGHTAPIFQAVFSPDSRELITVSLDKTIRIWDTETGRLIRVLRPPIGPGHEGELNAVAISPDGKTLAVAGFGFHAKEGRPSPIFLIDRDSGEITRALRGHVNLVGALCFSADGKQLASGGEDHVIRIWDVPNGKLARELKGHTGTVTALAFNPDGTRLVSAGGGPHIGRVDAERVAWIWSVAQGKVLHKLEGEHGKAVRRAAWSHNGAHIATASQADPGDNFVALWDADGKFVKRIAYPANDIGVRRMMGCESVTFTPNSKSLVISLRDGFYANVGVYHLAGGEPRLLFGNNILERDIPAGAAVVSPNGKHIAVINDRHHRTVLYNSQTGDQERILGGTGRQPAVVAWVTTDKEGERRIAWRNRLPGQAYIREPWEPLQDDHFFDRAFRLDVLEFTRAPAGKDYKPRDPLPNHYVRSRLGAGPLQLWGAGGPVVVLKSGDKELAHLKPPGDSWTNARAVTFLTPEQIVLANETGMSLFAGAEGKGKFIHSFTGPNGAVLSVAPSPDKGRYLLGSADDQVIRIWDPSRPQPLLSLFVTPPPPIQQKGQPPRQGEWVAWTPQGYYAASLHGERLMGWTLNNGPDKMATFHPAQRFREHYYRPEVIKLLLDKGSLADALKAANVVPHQVEKTLPPRATVRFKQDGARVEVEVTAETGSAAEPVTALYLLVDGRPAKVGDKETIETFTPAREKDAQARWTVTLETGSHKLSVRTVAKVTYSMSREIPIEVKPVGPMPKKIAGTLHYIGIGVNQFKHEPELKLTGAVLDVTNMVKCLVKECAGGFVVKPTLLTDDKATGKAIVETLTGLQGKLKPGDVVIVHYSSHGEVEEGGLYLLCHDSKRGNLKGTAVPGDKLRDILGQYPCPVLLILDACHSGKFPLMRPPTDPLSRMLADDSCGVAVMTAALAHQKVVDTKDGGVFTQGLLKGLAGGAKPGAAGKRLYVHQLFTFVFEYVTEETGNKQMPLYLPSGSVPPIVLKE